MASASAGSKMMQIVRKHVPSIRFPNRTKPKSDAGPSSHMKTPEISPTLRAISRGTSAHRSPTASTFSSSLKDEDVNNYASLPARYRRRPLSQEEIEYIERGGPD
ncbi:alpha-ketoglutarate dehydrogenase component 4-like [Porites lutea]|uniref:alpha-ketoglutarate dehydrogenase component 4-like n=1 Tax=Porites lutea TaxID=51062 RepID=UPI003CC62B0E